MKKLDNTDIIVEEHQKLNQIIGTIRYQNLPKYDNQQILRNSLTQKVSDIQSLHWQLWKSMLLYLGKNYKKIIEF